MTDTIEDKVQALKTLFAQRREIHRLQEFILLWRLTLHRLGIPAKNILSLDVRDGNKLVGFWLKKRDYAGKLHRKERARSILQKTHEEERGMGLRAYRGPSNVKPMGVSWSSSSYVALDHELYPPERWLKDCLRRI